MGSTASAPDLSALEQVCGQTAIAKEDPFWQTLLTAKVPLQRGDASAANVEQIATNLCTELMRNNATTGNFQVLLLCTLEHMEKALAPRATPEQLSQCAAKLTAAENEMALLRRSAGSRLSSVEKEWHF